MNHRSDSRNPLQRARIAVAAARLMAEDGISDYSVAKHKAARGLGLPETAEMPDNDEVESELHAYLRLFQGEEHEHEIADLRRKAADIMDILQQFHPYLTGSVLDGSAGRYAEIDIQLFVDSAKDVEIFLLNQRIDYQPSEPRSERAEAVLTLSVDNTLCNLIVYPAREERVAFKSRSGKPRPHARIDAVRKLLAGTGVD